MDWELIFWIVITAIPWGILIIGKIGMLDTDTSMTKDKYNRYYGKEDKKWGR